MDRRRHLWIAGIGRATPRRSAASVRVKLLAKAAGTNKPRSIPDYLLQQTLLESILREKERSGRPLSTGSSKPLLTVLSGGKTDRIPIWLMRQAGRYLPEYRKLRADKGGFLELVYDGEAAAEITLQPIRRFGFDAAILFSDILIVPYALGQELRFEEGEGPRLAPRLADAALDSLAAAPERLAPIWRTVEKVKAELPAETALIGFAGSPWTVATYMVAGRGSRDQAETRLAAYRDPEAFAAIVDAIVAATIDYLCGQAAAGAEALQLFDSWAGSLAPDQFERWVIAPTARIVEAVRLRHPQVPIVGFPKGAGASLPAYARETGVDALGLDETVSPEWAAGALPDGLPLQGNLDPVALLAGGSALESAAERILSAFEGRPHVFNLGHGIGRHTPIAHVERLIELVRR